VPRPLPIMCVCMKSCSKTLLWQANIILIGIKFYTVQKCSMQSESQRLTRHMVLTIGSQCM